MNTFRQLRNFWIPCVATIAVACLGHAAAQTSYKITDLGTNNSKDNFSMAMGLNNQGWTENIEVTKSDQRHRALLGTASVQLRERKKGAPVPKRHQMKHLKF
jgi:hypothetical protein